MFPAVSSQARRDLGPVYRSSRCRFLCTNRFPENALLKRRIHALPIPGPLHHLGIAAKSRFVADAEPVASPAPNVMLSHVRPTKYS